MKKICINRAKQTVEIIKFMTDENEDGEVFCTESEVIEHLGYFASVAEARAAHPDAGIWW